MRRFSEYRLLDEINTGKAIPRNRIKAEIGEIQKSIAEDEQSIVDADALVWRLTTGLEAQRRELRALRAALKESAKGA